MTEPEEPRRRFNVGALKARYADRDVAHAVLTSDDDRGFRDILGANTGDADPDFPLGAPVTYSVELTDAEAEAFAAASNCRYVEPDGYATPDRAVGRPTGTEPIPSLNSLAAMRARYLDLRRWHGRDVKVAVLDQGTTQAVRDAMGFTLLARTVTSSIDLGGREIYAPEHKHGCWVAPNAVPAGGLLLDAVISEENERASYSSMAAAITWAVDNGAQVCNLSFSGAAGDTSQAIVDAVTYARDNGGVQIVMSAGNDNIADLNFPSSLSRTFTNVHSSIAWDEATDRRALFSCHAADGSGCAPGVSVDSLTIYGQPTRWSGTSASSPHMAQLIARGATGGTYTTAQVAAALRANTRDTGAGASEQGGGAWDLQRALAALGGVPAAASTAGVANVTHVDTRGGASTPTGWNITPAPGVQPDDTQIVVLVSSAAAGLAQPPGGMQVLTDARYGAADEIAANQAVGPTRARVLALPYTADQPASVGVQFGGGTWHSAFGIITLRGAGGLDAERFAPMVKFGTGGTLDSLPVLPATTNDLLVVVFAQRHPTSLTGTLSVPAGLTSRGFWRPTASGTTTGYTLLVATTQLGSGARTAAYTSTSNDATGTWCTVAFTVPAAAPAVTAVVQSEPAGPPGGMTPFLPRS